MTAGIVSRRALLAGAISGTAAAALSGCARSGKLRFWAIGNEAGGLASLAAPLGLERVDLQPLPWSAAHGKLLTAFVGDALPDIAQVGNSWLAELAELGALSPVPPELDDRSDDHFEAVLASNTIGGRLMALPWYVDTRVQFYRKDLFAQAGYETPPLDWKGWRQALARIRSRSASERFGVLLPLDEFEHLQGFALSAGARFVRENGTRGDFLAPEFLSALEFYKSLFDDRLAPVTTGTQLANRWADFARGWFAVYPSGPWMIEEMRTRLPATLQERWSTTLNPGPRGAGSAAPGGSSLVVFAGGARQKEAWDVARRLLHPRSQLLFHRATGDLPSRRSAWAAANIAEDRVFAPFARQLDLARPLPKVPEWERIVTEMQVVAEQMVRGEFTVRSAATEMNARVDDILAKRRWMVNRGHAA